MTVQLSLSVNGAPIAADYFVQSFIDHTVSGMTEALEGTGKIKNLDLSIDGDRVAVCLNGATVPLNAFASRIVRSTITGMVSPLKGVKDINTLKITLCK